jgi:hypothetical protein
MSRFLKAIIVAATTCVLVGVGSGLAGAAPSNSTSITLSCDKNVDATVELTLQASSGNPSSLADVTISCGPDSNVGRPRNKVDVPTGQLAAGWVAITTWTNSTGTAALGATSCDGSGAITYKDACTNAAGTGSQLVVR